MTLYGAAVRYRLRVFTSGGCSPDGVRAVLPTEFARYFRLHASIGGGREILIAKPGIDYRIGRSGRIRVLGLADLGRRAARYDDYSTVRRPARRSSSRSPSPSTTPSR